LRIGGACRDPEASLIVPQLRLPQLRLLVADRCNLDCSYCHFQASKAGRDLMSPDGARTAMREFADAVTARGISQATLSLYGGEPLLNKPVLEAVLDEACLQREAGFDYALVLNTNVTLLGRSGLARAFAEQDVDLHISLDGPDEASNHLRLNPNGRPSWPAVQEGLRLARETGCRVQINGVLGTQGPDELRALIDYCASIDCRRIFMALPDGSLDAAGAVARARLLLTARGYAQQRGVNFFGPWRVGLRGERPALTWPPLNVIVKPDGRAFFPHVPAHRFASVDAALAPVAAAALEPDWREATAECADCRLQASCRGYLKMMVRYHTGEVERSEAECTTAREVARSALAEPDLQSMRPSVDLRLKPLPDGALELSNPLLPGSALVVSPDTLRLLGHTVRGGNRAALGWAFEADGLGEVCDRLAEHGLLAPWGGDTDELLLQHLAPVEARLDDRPFHLGAASGEDLARLRAFAPRLRQAFDRLPVRLRGAETVLCVLGAHDRAGFVEWAGGEPAAPAWMAATVFHSVLLLDLAACESVLAQGGTARLAAFDRALIHELAHLALRQSGVRVPVWLEEGLCQHLAEPPVPLERLCEAATRLDDFIGFALDNRAHATATGPHTRNLLRFSAHPIDDHPGYLLAQDLAAWVLGREGLDGFLDRVQDAGLAALADPLGAGDRTLADVLAAWAADLRQRVAARPSTFEQPLRLLAHGDQALVYHRFVGGYAVMKSGDPAALAEVANRNLDGDATTLAQMLGRDHPLYPRWLSGVYPRGAGRHLRLTLADGCNLGCSYCYEGTRKKKNMTVEVADRAVAAWRDLLRPGDLEHSSIRFFGGEPLLNWDVVRHVLDTAADGLPMQPRWVVNTNGTLLRDEHVRAFAAKGGRLAVALSMDGLREAHDRHRTYRNGRGSFDAVDRAAHALAEARVPFTLSAVVGDHNLDDLLDLARYAVDLRQRYGAPISLSLEPILSAAGDEETGRALLPVYEAVMAYCREQRLPLGGKLFYAVGALHDGRGASGHFCSVTHNELSVGPDGELLVCQAIPESDYGRVEEMTGEEKLLIPPVLQQRTGDRVDGCAGCEVEGLCGGGCTAQSVRATGAAYGNPGPVFCTLMRGVFRRSMQHLMEDLAAAPQDAATQTELTTEARG
jgi:uncharacterized protein